MTKPPHVECLFYAKGSCAHPLVPRFLFMQRLCILVSPYRDPRVPPGCTKRVQKPELTEHLIDYK